MFDVETYLFILATIVLMIAVLISMIIIQKLDYPMRYSQTVLYVVAAFFQETYPKTKVPRGALRVLLK